jgi:hypothetical protein
MIALTCAACFSESDVDPTADTGQSETTSAATTPTTGQSETTGQSATNGPASSQDAEATAVSTSDTMADTTTASDCGERHPVPPFDDAMWNGPIVISQAAPMAPPSECPNGFEILGEPVVGAEAPEACECTCGAQLWERCHVTITTGPDLMCGGEQTPVMQPCQTLGGFGVPAAGKLVMPGDCMPVAHAMPGAAAGPTTMCTPTDSDTSCIDVPEGVQGPCIFTEGSATCPEGYLTAVSSKRLTCGSCTNCPDLGMYCNTGVDVMLFPADDCTGDAREAMVCGYLDNDAPIVAAQLVENTPYVCDSSVGIRTDVSICCAPL